MNFKQRQAETALIVYIMPVPQNAYIVIPCYNESPEVVRSTLSGLLPAYAGRVVLVDDGSAAPLALPDLPVTVLRHAINRGQGASLQTGTDYALRQGADAVIHFDADGQHDAGSLVSFLAALDAGADIVLGSRFLRREDYSAIPLRRRLLLRAARIVNGLFTGLWLTDAHNGFRALGPRALAALRLNEDRMAHASEILSGIRRNHLKYQELPTHITYSSYSSKKGQGMFNSLNIVIDLLLEKWL